MSTRRRPRWFRNLGTIVGVWLMLGSVQAMAWQPEVDGGTCKNTGVSCSGTIGNSGQRRGACCDPAQASQLQTCASTNPCVGGASYKWPIGTPVSWWINLNNMAGQAGFRGSTGQQIIDAIKKGWAAWQKPGCTAFTQSYRGTTTDLPSSLSRRVDNKVVMYLANPSQWAQLGQGSSTLAFSSPVTRNGGTLVDADIVFNPSPQRGWTSVNPGRNDTDIAAVTAHEAGHSIGFAHSAVRGALLFYISKSGAFPGLSQDDINAVCFTYPGKCNQDADCGSKCLRCVSGKCTLKVIAPVRNLCKPCTKPSDCGGANDICIRTKEGNRCAQDCSQGGCCPSGYRCSDVGSGGKMCLRDTGKCDPIPCSASKPCLGPGESCQGGTCKPTPVAVAPTSCKTCTSNSNCGGGKNSCFRFPDGNSRCAQPCVADNFCPTGYFCQGTSSGRYCFPTDLICPCKSNTDCQKGEACRSGLCRPSVCKYGCRCSDAAPCDSPYQCLQTQSGGLCFQICAGSVGGTGTKFPTGVPGSACKNQTCTLGASCLRTRTGTICLKACTSNATCSSTGGRCYDFSRQGGPKQLFCACRTDSECLSGHACNKTVLGQAGACAPKSGGTTVTKCEVNYKCEPVQAGSKVSLCRPLPTRKVGESCGTATTQCLPDLACVTNPSTSKGICLEKCPADRKCKSGGACVIQTGSGILCGCGLNSQCGSGQFCNKILGTVGLCAKANPADCGNGTCDVNKGENCSTCAKDCKCGNSQTCNSGSCKAVQLCGNGKCDTGSGETCSSCPADCKCPTGQGCASGRCVPQAKNCGNKTCERAKGEDCGTCASDCKCDTGRVCKNNRCVVNSSCGNGTCERGKLEDCGTCPQDCRCDGGKVCVQSRCVAPPDTCGNKACESNKGETCTSCIKDCSCGVGLVCNAGKCEQPSKSCGNGSCEANKGEGCGTCLKDCPCTNGKSCQSNQCVGGTNNNSNGKKLNCSADDQIEVCDTEGNNCSLRCVGPTPPKQTCGCSLNNGSTPPTSFLILLVGLLLFSFRRRS